MRIKEVIPKIISNSRGEETIEVLSKTDWGVFSASSPFGKSVGKYETPAFIPNIKTAVKRLLNASEKIKKIEINDFLDLEDGLALMLKVCMEGYKKQ